MLYARKPILLASKHKKEQAISPPFNQILQCELWVPNDFDTDQFGTFIGEIARTGNQYETLIMKAKNAAEIYGYKQVIASEGNLSCEACSTHTELYHHKIFNCLKCDFQRRVGREDGLLQAAQQYCPHCNP